MGSPLVYYGPDPPITKEGSTYGGRQGYRGRDRSRFMYLPQISYNICIFRLTQ